MGFLDFIQHGWNAFTGRTPPRSNSGSMFSSFGTTPPYKRYTSRFMTQSMIVAIRNRIAVDCSQVEIVHCDTTDMGFFNNKRDSGLQKCLELSANLDQTGRTFRHDLFYSLLEEGSVAVVPVETDIDPINNDTYKILNIRVAKILAWFPDRIRVSLYNEKTGRHEEIEVLKKYAAIIENPFAAVMNAPNSTGVRLAQTISKLDYINDLASSGKLDLIIQLPYSLKAEGRKIQAENRRKDIEEQLRDNKYGIAYIDSTEKITQLGRPLENHLGEQVDRLTKQYFDELYMTPEILNGTATEEVMTNYMSRLIEPIIANVCDEFKRKFLTKTAITQGQSILYFKDPLTLVPASKMPDLADKLTRNEILSSNEVRSAMGFKPSSDPGADELRNKNINAGYNQEFASVGPEGAYPEGEYPEDEAYPEEEGYQEGEVPEEGYDEEDEMGPYQYQ